MKMKIKTKNSLTEEIRGVTWELPLITAITYVSTLKGSGGQKFPKMCLHIVLKMLTSYLSNGGIKCEFFSDF